GLNFASRAVREKNQIIVAEGYTDVLNLHQAGVENSAGTIGTALTEWHIQMIEKRFSQLEELVLCFDNDKAGKEAALSAGENTLGRVPTKVCLLPEGEDPAGIMEKGEDIRGYLNKSVSFFDFLIDEKKKGKNLDEFEGEAVFLREMGGVYKKMPQNMKGLFVEKISQKMKKRIETIEQALGKPTERWQPCKDVAYGNRFSWERKFLAQLIAANSPETIKYFSDLDEQIFSSKEAQAIFTYLINGSKQDIFNFGMPLFKKETLDKMVSEINNIAARQKKVLNKELLISFFEAVPEQKDKLGDIGFSAKMVERHYITSIMNKANHDGVSYKEFEKRIRGIRTTKDRISAEERTMSKTLN
ncbi:toprim domain-containing protein, partial [Candidatus Pacearchaeota archaeon]|nr:toprim domain-containing protein [Candidatus Pacearchaeota archaeon]